MPGTRRRLGGALALFYTLGARPISHLRPLSGATNSHVQSMTNAHLGGLAEPGAAVFSRPGTHQ
jgi:hypothetical protein